MPNFLHIYEGYRKLGLNHASARLNTLEDAEPYLTSVQRVRLSYLVNKMNRERAA
jgi:hypothetical protein